jgi:ribulose-5-phosphate 4-epimerase/fuculose-1-phosphate aldolase
MMDGVSTIKASEWQLRVDLAAAFRLAAKFDWQEAVANHFSLATSEDGKKFLMNSRWVPFSRVKASELAVLDSEAAAPPAYPIIETTAWTIHGAIHASMPQARCVLHVHPPYATALSCLMDPRLLPVEQTTARFFNRISIDTGFDGLADNAAEGMRLASALGDKKVLMMRNHGVLTVGNTVAEAFDLLYHVEHAARTLMLAHASGQKLCVMPDALAEKTARGWEADDPAFGAEFFAQMKKLLDDEAPDYKT